MFTGTICDYIGRKTLKQAIRVTKTYHHSNEF